MKKILMLLVSLIMVFSVFSAVNASEDVLLIAEMDNSIKVMQDGEYVDFVDASGEVVEPQIVNGRTMVPFRKIFNSLGVTDENITWIGETRTVIAKKDNVEIELQIDSNVAKKTVDGEATTITLDAAPMIFESRTLVPVRFIAESMEKLVGWDAENRTVIIIDLAKLEGDLKSAMPKVMEIIDLHTADIHTIDATVDLGAELEYTSASAKENNTKLEAKSTIDVIKSSGELYGKVDFEIDGNGVLYDAVKESGASKFDAIAIWKDDSIYVTSSLFNSGDNGDWLVISLNEIFSALEITYDKLTVEGILNVVEENLTVDTYAQAQFAIEALGKVLGDQNVTLTDNKYEVKVDLLSILNEYEVDKDLMELLKKAEVIVEGKIEDGISKEVSVEIKAEVEEAGEKISASITGESKVNKFNETITLDDEIIAEIESLD